MVSKDTRNIILQAAKKIILTKGYGAAGLNEILTEAGVPKGSFYHYFKSKEDFVAELLKSYLDEHEAFLGQLLNNQELEPLERIISFLEKGRALHERNRCQQVCLIAKLGAEVSDFSETMRNVQSTGIRKWLDVYAECIRKGQEKGSINRNINATQAAALIHDLWQGASVRMQIDQNTAPLENAVEIIRRLLTPH
jgi:TetR/AcrR family transcriptional regulator, transcriptional repressor for nem operon